MERRVISEVTWSIKSAPGDHEVMGRTTFYADGTVEVEGDMEATMTTRQRRAAVWRDRIRLLTHPCVPLALMVLELLLALCLYLGGAL